MNYQLRPLTLGEILDRTAELYRTRFALFGGISAIFATVMLAIQLLYVRSLVMMGYPNFMANLKWSSGLPAVVEVLATLLVGALSVVAINRAVSWVYLDQAASVREAARSVLPRLGRYLWLMTRISLVAWLPMALVYAAYFALLLMMMPHDLLTNPAAAQTAAQQDPSKFMEFGAVVLILVPLGFLAFVYGMFMWVRYSLAVPACVVEELPAGKAINRSVELCKGSWWRIFVLWLLVAVVRGVLGTLFAFPIIVLAFKHPGHQLPMQWLLLQQVGIFLSNALIGPIYSIGLTLFYFDQRIRKEGFDIEWMMQAAGMTPAQELPAPQST